MNLKKILGFFEEVIKIKLEFIALPLLIITLLFLYQQKYFSYILLIISAILGVLFFIIFKKFNKSSAKEEQWLFFNIADSKLHRLQLITSILFFLFYGLSFLTLLQGFYTKTIWYYVFISLCFGLITFEILSVRSRIQGNVVLLKTLLLGLNVTLSNQILFPYGIGLPDSGYHINQLVIPIVNYGTLSAGSGTYVNFPIHHILIAINSLIMGTDPRMTYFYLGCLIMSVIGILFVFLIGRKFENLKFGLFAALLYVCSDYLVNWASHPSQMAFVYPLALMIFTTVLFIYKERDWRFSLFFPILTMALIFTHHFSAMIVFIVLLSLANVELAYYFKENRDTIIFLNLIQIFIVILFSQWMYYSKMIGGLVGIIESYTNAILIDTATSIMTPTHYDMLPIKTLFVNEIGSSILIFLSVIGFLYFLNNHSFFRDIVMASAVTIIILIGIGIVYKEPYLLPHRLYVFLQEFCFVFLASGTIMWLQRESKNLISTRHFIIIGLIMCLSFFSLSSTIAGFETSPFVGDQSYWKIYSTPYDKYSNNWMNIHVPDNPNITGNLPIKVNPDGNTFFIDAVNITNDNFVIFDKFDVIIGFSFGYVVEGTSHIGSSRRGKLDKSSIYLLDDFDSYYNNGMLDLYYKRK